jgi:hypothetical protein
MSEWTPDKIADLRQLAALGIPYAEIGRRLGFSKSAISGKASRLDLPERGSPIIYRAFPSRRTLARRAGIQRAGLVTLPPLASQMPLALALPKAPIPKLPPTAPKPAPKRPAPKPTGPDQAYTPDRAPGLCQWITDHRTRPVRMCSSPVCSIGGSWCLKHRKIAWVPARKPGGASA